MVDVLVARTRMDAGGGDFALPDLTLGIFLNDQPTHRMSLGSDRRALIPLNKHQGWIVPAGGEGRCEYDDPLEVLTIAFDRRLLAEVGLDRPELVAPQTGGFDPLTTHLAMGMDDLQSAGALHRETMWRALASHFVQTVALTEQKTVAAIGDRRLRRAVEYIEANLADDLSLNELASLAAMSPFHFARSFKAATGRSPLQFVIEARIDRARMLLRCTDHAVSEIAFRVGYRDVGRFGRHFKNRVGTTPGAYRTA